MKHSLSVFLGTCLALAGAGKSAEGIAAEILDTRHSFDWVQLGSYAVPADSEINPDNSIFLIPQWRASSEMRPNLRVIIKESLQIIARPRFRLELSKTQANKSWQKEELKVSSRWNELYGAYQAAPNLGVSYGLQNFQWGEAESLSPSNRIFHETGLTRNSVTEIRGKHLVKVNYSIGQNWSTVGLLETEDNGEEAFQAGEKFERKLLVKQEYATQSGGAYLGLVFGTAESSRPWFGEYGSLMLGDVVSVYFDASHARGSKALYPTTDSVTGIPQGFTQAKLNETKIYTLAVVGAKASLEKGAEVRTEYIYNQSGYSADELAQGVQLASTPSPLQEAFLAAYAAPGLEVPGKQYAYVSGRMPDLGPGDKIAVSARYLHSLTDQSGSAFMNMDWSTSNEGMFFLGGSFSHGKKDSELNRFLNASMFLGHRQSW
jgi:hypothetical protein